MTDTTAAPRRLLTAGQAALIFGVHRQTIYYWTKRGILVPAAVTVGGQNRYDPTEIVRIADERRAEQRAAVAETGPAIGADR